MGVILSMIGICKSFNAKMILSDLTMDIHRGEVVALVGRNGSGKSTLLKLISGLLKPDKGRIVFNGGRIAYLPDTLPRLRFTLREYLTAMGRIQGIPKKEIRVILQDLIQEFGLEGHADAFLRTFSKGMLQKVVVMQALLRQPDLLLMDEPYSGLDIKFQKDFSFIISRLKERGVSIILSSHERSLINDIADEVILIKHGTGQVVRYKKEVPLTEIVLKIEKEDMLKPIQQFDGIQSVQQDNSLLRLICEQSKQNKVLKQIIENDAGTILYLQPLTIDYMMEFFGQKER